MNDNRLGLDNNLDMTGYINNFFRSIHRTSALAPDSAEGKEALMHSIEHPDITAAHLTGYPRSHTEPVAVLRCAVCGTAIFEGDDYYDIGDEAICESCDRDYLRRFRKIAERGA